jgi:hypothetical protein
VWVGGWVGVVCVCVGGYVSHEEAAGGAEDFPAPIVRGKQQRYKARLPVVGYEHHLVVVVCVCVCVCVSE